MWKILRASDSFVTMKNGPAITGFRWQEVTELYSNSVKVKGNYLVVDPEDIDEFRRHYDDAKKKGNA